MKKIRPVKKTWYDWLINHVPEPIRKSVVGSKDKIASLSKTNRPKQGVYGRGKNLSKHKTLENLLYHKITKTIKDRIIGDIRTLFPTEEEKKERKKLEKKKKLMKDYLNIE